GQSGIIKRLRPKQRSILLTNGSIPVHKKMILDDFSCTHSIQLMPREEALVLCKDKIIQSVIDISTETTPFSCYSYPRIDLGYKFTPAAPPKSSKSSKSSQPDIVSVSLTDS